MRVVGIDVGSQGARVLAVSLDGTVVSQARARFPRVHRGRSVHRTP